MQLKQKSKYYENYLYSPRIGQRISCAHSKRKINTHLKNMCAPKGKFNYGYSKIHKYVHEKVKNSWRLQIYMCANETFIYKYI